MFKINFILEDIDNIVPWGEEGNKSLSWFGLTDGLLWINVGEDVIYEYSKGAMQYFSPCHKYNNYQLSRFIEDFFSTFKYVGESIPKELYNIDIWEFEKLTEIWHNIYLDKYFDSNNEKYWDFAEKECSVLCDWYEFYRSFDSGHLVGGPFISCLRYGDKIKIIWKSDYTVENGESIWVSPKGVYEINYLDFVKSVKDFMNKFFDAMDKQVEKAVNKHWKDVYINKKILKKENEERKSLFLNQFNFLENTNHITDWDNVLEVYDKMKKELLL